MMGGLTEDTIRATEKYRLGMVNFNTDFTLGTVFDISLLNEYSSNNNKKIWHTETRPPSGLLAMRLDLILWLPILELIQSSYRVLSQLYVDKPCGRRLPKYERKALTMVWHYQRQTYTLKFQEKNHNK